MMRHTAEKSHSPSRGRRYALPVLGLFAGFLNGFLGTGGGMVLSLGLRRLYPEEMAKNLALSTASMLVFSIMSTILYTIQGHIGGSHILPVILPALIGGALGACLSPRLGRQGLDLLLSCMLLYSGLTLLL